MPLCSAHRLQLVALAGHRAHVSHENSPSAPARHGFRTFDALQDPTFRRLLAAAGLYYIYRTTELTVLSWLVLQITESPFAVALVGVSRIAPMVLFGLFAGSLSDRVPRKRLMATAQAVTLAVAAAMCGVLITGHQQAWQAFAAIFVTGTAWAIDYSSRRALISDIFSGNALTNATSLDSGLITGSNMIGPLFGTTLIHFASFGGAYVGIAVLMACALLLTLSLRVPPAPSADASHITALQHLTEAARLMGSNRTLLAVVLLTAVFNCFGFPFMQMVPVIGKDFLGTNAVGYGLLVSAVGAGSLVGSAIIASAQPAKKGNAYSLGAVLFMVAAMAFAWSPSYGLSLALMLVAGFGLAGMSVMQPVMALEAVGPRLRGRAMGAVSLGIGIQAPGMLLMGTVAQAIGPRQSVAGMALIGVLVVFLHRRLFPVLRDSSQPAPAQKDPA